MAEFKLNEGQAIVVNPMPQGHTNAEIAKKADVFIRTLHGHDAFRTEFRWGSGVEEEYVVLNPGEEVVLPAVAARAIGKHLGYKGIVDYPFGADDLTKQRRIVQGLREASQFFQNRGEVELAQHCQRHSISKKEAETYKADIGGFFLNIEKGKLVNSMLKRQEDKLIDMERSAAEEIELERELERERANEAATNDL